MLKKIKNSVKSLMTHSPTYIDRYPAKMVGHLADTLIDKYTQGCTHLYDPFCGSSAILSTGKNRGLKVSGTDINPYAVLLSSVKLTGFDKKIAKKLCIEFINKAKITNNILEVEWEKIRYWFTPATLNKFEKLRFVANEMQLASSKEGRAVLLAFALSIRKCSKADQRSPKYFISKSAKKSRKGKHFSPFKEIPLLFSTLSTLYGGLSKIESKVSLMNIASTDEKKIRKNSFSHVITSPPYINAQDYFRNFQLELYMLENILPFKAKNLVDKFVGTERGNLLLNIPKDFLDLIEDFIPSLTHIKSSQPKLWGVVNRYFYDMNLAFDAIKSSLKSKGIIVLVCGDNLVAGYPIPTWQILNSLLEQKGFNLFDKFGDQIYRRMLAPKRNGHKGLIKEEIISAFELNKI